MRTNRSAFPLTILTALALITLSACSGISYAPTKTIDKNDLISKHKRKAATYIKEKSVRMALREWEIIHTLSPGNREAVKKIQWLRKKIAEALVDQAKGNLKTQQIKKAKKKLLSALLYDPENRQALQMLKPDAPHLVIHRVRPGESLSTIANEYYKNRYKYYRIAFYNPWISPDKIAPGTRLIIPLDSPRPIKKIKKAAAPPEPVEAEPPQPESLEAEAQLDELGTEEIAPDTQAEGEIEPLENIEIDLETDAVDEPEEAVSEEDVVAAKIKYHYQEGVRFFQNWTYRQAEREWKKALELDPTHGPSQKGLDQIKVKIEEHYQNGLRSFKDQDLNTSIQEWETVFYFDPDYKNISQYLLRARSMQKRLDEISKE